MSLFNLIVYADLFLFLCIGLFLLFFSLKEKKFIKQNIIIALILMVVSISSINISDSIEKQLDKETKITKIEQKEDTNKKKMSLLKKYYLFLIFYD